MEKKMVITRNDFHRLQGLIEFASLKTKMPEIVSQLCENLMNARMLPPENISGNIITMNSRVLLKDISGGREAELTITYPQDADHRERRVSVLSSIGIALLGRQVGDLVSWRTPLGIGQFEILRVTFQPEMAGDYSL